MEWCFYDKESGNIGDSETIQFNEKFRNFQLVKKALHETKKGEYGKIYVGDPIKSDFGNGEFLGINIGLPIFDKQENYIGILIYTYDIVQFSQALNNPALNAYKRDLRFLMNDKGIIAVHPNPDAILKTLKDINKDESANAVTNAVTSRETKLFDHYIASTGDLSFASVATISTLDNSSYWSIVVTAPKKEVFAKLRELQVAIAVLSVVFLVVILCIIYFMVHKIVGSKIALLLESLDVFFKFLNYEKVSPKPLKITSDDEIGKMGMMINKNIQNIQNTLAQDKKAIAQSALTAKAIEEGDLSARIIENPANPQLVELKN
ncbi:hypothetical protein B6S12_10455, partial [Helicobacter valdiviensis]